ncbi:MAG: hypothetical protein KGL40_13700 [Rhodocyclaceae bacterium]|nr:hypothetical protein [Rhodocyclaceae bacterium]
MDLRGFASAGFFILGACIGGLVGAASGFFVFAWPEIIGPKDFMLLWGWFGWLPAIVVLVIVWVLVARKIFEFGIRQVVNGKTKWLTILFSILMFIAFLAFVQLSSFSHYALHTELDYLKYEHLLNYARASFVAIFVFWFVAVGSAGALPVSTKRGALLSVGVFEPLLLLGAYFLWR